MTDRKKLERQLAKLLEEYRLDTVVETLKKLVPFDDLLISFSNACVYTAIDEEAKRERANCKEYREWMARSRIFHDAIKDGRRASPLRRKIALEDDKRKDLPEET
jgi:hypothetical protein